MDTTIFTPEPTKSIPDVAKTKVQRRRFTPEFKLRIIEEVLAGQESVSVISRRYDLNTNQVFTWKRDYLKKQSGQEVAPRLLPVQVTDSPEHAKGDNAGSVPTGRIDIALRGGKTVTVQGEVSTRVLQTVLECLR